MDIGALTGLAAVLMPVLIMAIIFGGVFGPKIIAAWSEHRLKARELELQKSGKISPDVGAQIEALRQEVAELRKTSTEFDLSLDANLQHIQQRLSYLESQVQEIREQKVGG